MSSWEVSSLANFKFGARLQKDLYNNQEDKRFFLIFLRVKRIFQI